MCSLMLRQWRGSGVPSQQPSLTQAACRTCLKVFKSRQLSPSSAPFRGLSHAYSGKAACSQQPPNVESSSGSAPAFKRGGETSTSGSSNSDAPAPLAFNLNLSYYHRERWAAVASASSGSMDMLLSPSDRKRGVAGGSYSPAAASDTFLESTPLLASSSEPAALPKGGGREEDNAPSSSGDRGGVGSSNDGSWKVLVGLCSLAVVICYADRSNISTAILPMAADFGWDKAFQGVVLSSFFGGYALTQILGGQLADRLGGKLVLASGVALWSLFTFATPAAAAAGTVPLILCRILLGIGEGVAFPSIHSLIARNVPYANQSTAVGIVTAASYAGTALAFGVSPYIISSVGWEWVFHIFSGLALLWLPLWLPLAKTRPPPIAPQLLAPASSSGALSPHRIGGGGGKAIFDEGLKALLKRKEVWAICVAQYCGSWGMYGLLSWLPTFFADYYHVELADLGAYTLIPYIVQGGVGAATGFLADNLITSGWNVKTVRVVFQVLGMLGPAACLLLAVSPLVGASPATASSLITVGLGFSALTLGGVSASHLDIAPKHAGVVFGAGNTAATLAGFLSVPATGFILEATGSWPLVFGITAAHYVIGALFWTLWVGDKALPEDDLE